jgi:lipoprotein signal peptidase
LVIGGIVAALDVIVHVGWKMKKGIRIYASEEITSFISHMAASFIVVSIYGEAFGLCAKDETVLTQIQDSTIIVMCIYLFSGFLRYMFSHLHKTAA